MTTTEYILFSSVNTNDAKFAEMVIFIAVVLPILSVVGIVATWLYNKYTK